jgi:hypothetical protein
MRGLTEPACGERRHILALKDTENKRLDAVVSTLPPTQYLIHTNFHDIKVAYRYNEGYVAVNTRK